MTEDRKESLGPRAASGADQRFEALHQTAWELAQITASEGLKQAYELLARKVEAQFGCWVDVRRLDPQTRELVPVATAEPGGDRASLDDSLAGRAAREGETIVIEDTGHPAGEASASSTAGAARSLIVTPLLFGDRYYGDLELRHGKPGYFRNADLPLLEGLALHLAITIHRLEELESRREAERRATEAEVLGEIGRMTFEIVHRLGNDLGLLPHTVRKISKTLADAGALTSDLEDRLGTISTRIKDVLKLSRELGDLLARERFSERGAIPVVELIDGAVEVLNLEERTDVTLIKEVDPDLGAVQVAYPEIVTAILNLLNNALEAMPDGGTIRVIATGSGGDVEIAVQDDGVGITPDQLTNIFHLGYSTKPKSSGFGLWSTRRAIVQHGGTIEVDSEPGRGSRFKITLPRTAPTAS